jgi:monoamine oxidase
LSFTSERKSSTSAAFMFEPRHGPLHFAGEHTSLKHAWIEGAVESAVRAALEVHTGK